MTTKAKERAQAEDAALAQIDSDEAARAAAHAQYMGQLAEFRVAATAPVTPAAPQPAPMSVPALIADVERQIAVIDVKLADREVQHAQFVTQQIDRLAAEDEQLTVQIDAVSAVRAEVRDRLAAARKEAAGGYPGSAVPALMALREQLKGTLRDLQAAPLG